MRKSVKDMTQRELASALPTRLLVMVLGVAFLFALAANLAVFTVAKGMSAPWLAATLLVVLVSPVGISRMFSWTLAPARERQRRRRGMMRESLAAIAFGHGDYEV